jgi:micrococcal nuclease
MDRKTGGRTIPIRVKVHYDARGDDRKNLNGEWVRITNRHVSQPLQLGGWWVRDAANRRYTFAAGTRLRPGRSLTVHVGRGSDTRRHLYWGRSIPVFVNPANDGRHMGDGAYLFDPQGDVRAHDMYPRL